MKVLSLIAASFFIFMSCATRQDNKVQSKTLQEPLATRSIPVRSNATATGSKYALATQGPHATEAAKLILGQGGNLTDAAIAASFVISVERPHSTGVGGGGFWLYYNKKAQKTFALDFRERAPLSAAEDMYVINGRLKAKDSQYGAKAVAVPGLVKGLYEIHQRWGKLPWKSLLQPAIDLAENGFLIYPDLQKAIITEQDELIKDPELKSLFFEKKSPRKIGERVRQKNLAKTLRLIALKGPASIYEGEIAQAIVKATQNNITLKDLKDYQVIERTPIQSQIKNQLKKWTVVSMPPPSSGGIHVVQFLKHMSEFSSSVQISDEIHFGSSALQLAFHDRSRYLGDPDFVQIPQEELISDSYLQSQRKLIQSKQALDFNLITPSLPLPKEESTDTTHFSMMDSEGNAIASTQTINGYFGAAITAGKSGIILNNEMDDFSIQPGVPNMYGVIGGFANSIQPRKTPLSSMSPTLVLDKDVPVLALGAPGGTRIISCVAQTIYKHLFKNQNLTQAIASIRYHHQGIPKKLWIDEPGPAKEDLDRLKALGYEIEVSRVPCYVMGVSFQDQKLTAVSDPRDVGTSAAE